MRRFMIAASLLTLSLAVTATPATAQKFFVGGGVTMPTSDYKEYAKNGWMLNAGFSPWRSADKRMTIWTEGVFGSNNHEGSGDEKTNLYGGFGSVTYNLTEDAPAVPYLIASVGYLVHQYKAGNTSFGDSSDGAPSFGGGGGVGFGKFYVEGRYFTATIDNDKTSFFLFAAGITF